MTQTDQGDRQARGQMAARSKIEDEGEVLRWIEEGRTYAWMAKEHLRKYGVRVAPTTFANLRIRHGLPRRAARDIKLLPWSVRREHQKAYPLWILRMEARRRAGMPISGDVAARLEGMKSRMARDQRVFHYEAETEQGWYLVPRREGVDMDLIREPDRPTALRGTRE